MSNSQPKRSVLSQESNGAFTKESAHYEPVGSRPESVTIQSAGPFANYSAETEKGSDWPNGS